MLSLRANARALFRGGINATYCTHGELYPPQLPKLFRSIIRHLSASVLFALVCLFPQSAAFAASPISASATQHIGNGPMGTPHQTPQDIAYGNAKQLMAQEYIGMLHGKETLSTFEQHMWQFMQHYNLGGSKETLHYVLTHRGGNKAKPIPGVAPNCISIASGILPNTGCVTNAAQFPEEHWNYCGAASVSTAIVEDSFTNGTGLLTNNGNTVHYDAYSITQPASTALADEDMLAQSQYLNSPYMLNGQVVGYGTTVDDVTNTLNDFVVGHGGKYYLVWTTSVSANFQNDLISDIDSGWDLVGNLDITGVTGDATLQGYPVGLPFKHIIPITSYANSGSTTYYADPIYMAPDYTSANGWYVNGPYNTTSTSNMIAILKRMGYDW